MLNAGAAFFLACSVMSQASSPDVLLQSQDQMIMNEHMSNFYYANNEMTFSTKDDIEFIVQGILSDTYISFADVNDDGVLDSSDMLRAFSEYLNILNEREEPKVTTTAVTQTQAPPETTAAPVTQESVTQAETTVQTEAPVTQAPPATEAPEIKLPPETLYSGDASVDDSDITTYGIDVSAYQGRIDFERIRNSGKSFVIIKAGEGLRVADRFYENIENAHNAGLNVGVYWFGRARSPQEAADEADKCLKTISGYKLEFPVIYDYEYGSLKNGNPLAYDRQGMTDTVRAFMKKTQDSGYYTMMYTNTDFSKTYLDMSRITDDFDIWFAGYSVSSPSMKCGMWQYSEYGIVDGIDMDRNNSGYVDLDVAYKNYPAKMKKFHINGY